MAKKQGFPIWAWIVIVLLILILLNQQGIIDIPFIPGEIIEQPLETPIGTCSLSLNKYIMDAGDTVRGTIYDGPFASCIVYARLNAGTWTNVGTYGLDSNGEFSYEAPINIPGTYEILAICTDTAGVSCRTNTEMLTVSAIPGDSDGDGFTDQEEIDAGTNPLDPNDYPGSGEDTSSYTCGQLGGDYCQGTCPDSYPVCSEVWTGLYTWACMCLNEVTEEIHPDWKPEGSMYIEHDETPQIDYVCCVQQIAYDAGDSPVSCYEYSCPSGWSPVYSISSSSGECEGICETPSCGGRRRHVDTCTGIPYYWCGSTYVKSGTTYYPCSYTGGGGAYCVMDTSYTCYFTAPY